MLVIVMNKIALCEDSGAAVSRHSTMQKKLGVLFGLGIPGGKQDWAKSCINPLTAECWTSQEEWGREEG